jgi:hypothetical protein
MPQSIGALCAAVLAVAIAAASALPAIAAQDLPATRAAQDPWLIGRPSPDSPDACAALPLEWRLRCYGGPAHSVREIGAPYAPAEASWQQPQPQIQPAGLCQCNSADSPCGSAPAGSTQAPQAPQSSP